MPKYNSITQENQFKSLMVHKMSNNSSQKRYKTEKNGQKLPKSDKHAYNFIKLVLEVEHLIVAMNA